MRTHDRPDHYRDGAPFFLSCCEEKIAPPILWPIRCACRPDPDRCRHKGQPTGERARQICGAFRGPEIFECAVRGEATERPAGLSPRGARLACCLQCGAYEPAQQT